MLLYASMSNFTTTLGSWTIDKLPETEITSTTQFLFPDWGDELHPEPFALSIHTWVLRNGHRFETRYANSVASRNGVKASSTASGACSGSK
jgi:hypothetical protein